MASLPPVVMANTLKLEPEFKKPTMTSLPFEKRNHSTILSLDKALDPCNRDFGEALTLIKQGNEKVQPAAYVPLLRQCIKKSSVLEAESIHAHIIKMGIYGDWFLMKFLFNAYAKCGTMESARKVFDDLPKRNVVKWTSLMSGYVQNAQPEVSVSVFKEMLEVGAFPTNYTLSVAFKACSLLGDFKLGKQIHAHVVKYAIEDDMSTGNALCSFYSKSGYLDSAVRAFRRISDKNVISWATAIFACVDNGDSAMGLSLFVEMLCANVEPDESIVPSVLSLCFIMQAVKLGSQIHSLSVKLGYCSILEVTNPIMHLYLKNGWIIEAKKLFDRMETTRLVTWNAMIAGLAEMMNLAEDVITAHSTGNEALNTFLRLHRSGMKPDLFTFSSVLTVCSSLVALEQGEQIHAQVMKSGFLSDVVVGTSLVNMYRRCGSIDRASKAFLEMSTRTLISWTSMITAFAHHGYSKQALQLFEDMRLVGVKPNKVTFVGVLYACSHAGMVEEALAYFDMMKKEYKITPIMDHYSCLIDMFVRLGRIDEAFFFIKKMDFEPNEFIWSLLIAGCRSHGKLEQCFYAAEQLLNLSPKYSEAYFLLLNMYLSAERWKDVSRVRKLMKDKKMGKLKDWSWISIRDKVHSFKTGDQLNPPYENIDNFVSDLDDKASTMGFELQTTLEVRNEDEEDDEATLPRGRHSEKLAVAFGLLSTPSAAPIRVIKSISMCRDCHNFMKFISQLTSRKIIIRERRMHKFVNGHCSCGDFGILV